MIYCPRCATQNAATAKFCRNCGTDISLIPQALTGMLPEAPSKRGKTVKRKEKTMEAAITSIFTGLAFLLIVLGGAIFLNKGFMIWVWFLIPGLATLGSGIGQYLTIRQNQKLRQNAQLPFNALSSSDDFELTSTQRLASDTISYLPDGTSYMRLDTDELAPRDNKAEARGFTSVTEGTTRLLDLETATHKQEKTRAQTPSEKPDARG